MKQLWDEPDPLPLSVEIELEYSDRANFAMQQNRVPLVDTVILTNTSGSDIGECELILSLSNGDAAEWTTRLGGIRSGDSVRVMPDRFALGNQRQAQRTEAERAEITVTVRSDEDSEVSRSFPIDLLAFDEWPGGGHFPELTAAFITPNHPLVNGYLGRVRSMLADQTDSNAIDGYQSQSRSRAVSIAESGFYSAASQGLKYIVAPSSFEVDGQRVRLIDRIERERQGNCLEFSLLLAGIWEQCGLNPLIVLVEGHAMVAFWTRDFYLQEVTTDDPAGFRNRVELGEVVVVESTLLASPNASFTQACEAAKKKLTDPGRSFCVIDVKAGRKRGIRPLPLRAEVGDQTRLDLDDQAAQIRPKLSAELERIALAERAESVERSDVAREPAAERIRRWQTRLLDLTLRNRLLNFREVKRTVPLAVNDLAQLEDGLADGQSYELRPQEERRSEEETIQLQNEDLADGRLQVKLSEAESSKRLLGIYRDAKSSIEETGANLLHVTIGQLKWYETASSEKPRFAPLILMPAKLTRTTSGGGYRYSVGLTDEPVRANITLIEKLRGEFGIDTSGLEELPEDESGIDVPIILRRFREAIREVERWEVIENAYLGMFSFSKFLMWRDLKDNLEKLKESKLVRHLVDTPGEDFDPRPFTLPRELDDKVPAHELRCTRDADSSQLAAIQAAAERRSYVLEGPPGTGKSQTIANIVADSLGRGKRVLFVAEKMAALTVVRRRLEEDGLGRHCLELHSAKASKKEVLGQIKESLDFQSPHSTGDWEAAAKDVDRLRVQLNGYVREMHRPRPSGETIYRVVGRLCNLGDGLTCAVPDVSIAEATSEQLKSWRAAVDEFVERSEAVDPASSHPLREIGRCAWSYSLPDRAAELIEQAQTVLSSLEQVKNETFRSIHPDVDPDTITLSQFKAWLRVCHIVLSGEAPQEDLINAKQGEALRKRVREFAAVGASHDSLRAEILENYHVEVLKVEHLEWLHLAQRVNGYVGPVRWICRHFYSSRFKPYTVPATVRWDQLENDIEAMRRCRGLQDELATFQDVVRFVGSDWSSGSSDWAGVRSSLDRADQVAQNIRRLAETGVDPRVVDTITTLASDSVSIATLGEDLRAAVATWSSWYEVSKQLGETLQLGRDVLKSGRETGWVESIRSVLRRWQDGLVNLNDWCAFREAEGILQDSGWRSLSDAYCRGDIDRSQVRQVFERSYGTAWFNAMADQIECVRVFNQSTHSRTIKKFKELDSQLIELTKASINSRLGRHAGAGKQDPSLGQERRLVKRELEKKSRHIPTRKLIASTTSLLPTIKPCFLMSPQSVAQFLDPKIPQFDLVVFDEASQIPVWDAIGAIARGKEVIVVGDSKQLPPTSFFAAMGNDDDEDRDEDEDVVEDVESILKECNASGIPSMRLKWHYRSRHESLIAFSNHHYYQNELHTFPSPDDRSASLGVTYEHVEGVYDRGGSRTNRAEAQRVVESVVRILLNDPESGSIGIVTFNQAQQSLIEDLLDEKRREIPEIDPYFTGDVSEPVFVKNLENVQGDERDTIVFSVGYGPDQSGKLSMNFGPLNQDGGERRLNVAVTRARKRLRVYSSIRADQIDLRRTRSTGVRHFRTFLDYADRGPKAIAEAVSLEGSRDFDSGFEKAVCDALVSRGWEVDAQVGCAGYRIDLAIRDPNVPGRYLLGVECDGATYHSAQTARDRDRLRQAVLEGLGWTIERVWSTDWWLKSDECLDRLDQAARRIAGSNARQ